MPAYFGQTGYKNPTDAMEGPFQHAYGPGHFFTWMSARPDIMEAFHQYIFAQRSERPSWVDEGFYPVHDRLIKGMETDGDRSALVDLGGGAGYCLEEFRSKVPDWKGRLVLQEQESVLEQASGLDGRIELMAHDFFTPQPIKGW